MEKTNSPVPVFVTAGTIIHGRGIGKLIGMPTANLKIADKKAPSSRRRLYCHSHFGK